MRSTPVTPHPASRRRAANRGAVLLAVLALVVTACGGDDDAESADDTTTTTESETTTTTEADEPVTTTTEAEPPSGDERLAADPTAQMLDDKTILLDGFFGIRLPERWGVTLASPLAPSETPPGGETALDEDALEQALVLSPLADDRAATVSLIHYTHSDSVPDLDRFTASIVELLSGDGSTIGESQDASLGGQLARLHQVTSASGTKGLMVTVLAGEEYFFILSLASDPDYIADTADMLSSISMVPLAIR